MFHLIPINIIYKKGLDCLEACLLCLCNYYKHEYVRSFYNFYDFQYNYSPSSQNLGDAFVRSISLVDNFNFTYGARSIPFDFINENEMQQFLYTNLDSNRPIILMTSAYYCNWLEQYMKFDQLRFIIIVGYEDKDVLILDPIVKKAAVRKMPYSDLRLGCKRMHLFEYAKNKMSDYTLINNTKLHLQALCPEKSFLYFRDAVTTLQTLNHDYNGSNWISQLDNQLGQYLPGSCLAFHEYLCHLENISYGPKYFETATQSLINLSHNWTLLRNLFLRSSITNTLKQNKEKILILIDSIYTQFIHIKDELLRKL